MLAFRCLRSGWGRLLALAVVPNLLAGVAFARTFSAGAAGGGFSSAEAACKALVGDQVGYKYDGPPERRPNGIYWCYEKSKDGKGERRYVGWASEEEEPPDMAQPPDMAKPPDMASTGCTVAGIADLMPKPPAELAPLVAGLSGDDSIGACNKDSIRVGERIFAASRGTVRMERRQSGATPKHYFLRHGGVMIDGAFLQFFNAPRHASPIIIGSELDVKAVIEKLYTLCGPNKRSDMPRVKSGSELYTVLYGSDTLSCSGDKLQMRPSGRAADWNNCGVNQGTVGSLGSP